MDYSTKPNALVPQRDQDEVDEEVGKQAVRLANAVVLPMVLKSALELNLIDIISAAVGDGACLSPSEIAAHLPTRNPDASVMLDRMLRLLASYDIVTCSLRTGEDGQVQRMYGVAPICRFLTWSSQAGGSVAPLLLLLHDKVSMQSWYHLGSMHRLSNGMTTKGYYFKYHLNDAILEDGIPFERAHGLTAFEYQATDQRLNGVFNQAMSNRTAFSMTKILDIYKGFEGVQVLVDVGGGIGLTLSSITSKYPHIKGINFDLPHVIADAPSYSGVELVRGDMFISVPKGDAIFMKLILHDWNDEHCMKLLKNCFQALPDSGNVIIIESILPEVPESSVSSQILFGKDLTMLVQTPGGKERTHNEYEALAKKSGFSGCKLICCVHNSWVMEFHKRANP